MYRENFNFNKISDFEDYNFLFIEVEIAMKLNYLEINYEKKIMDK